MRNSGVVRLDRCVLHEPLQLAIVARADGLLQRIGLSLKVAGLPNRDEIRVAASIRMQPTAMRPERCCLPPVALSAHSQAVSESIKPCMSLLH